MRMGLADFLGESAFLSAAAAPMNRSWFRLSVAAMRQDLPTVAPSGIFLDARLLLRQRKITALPVVDAHGVLVGEITRRIIVKLLHTMLGDPELFTLKKDCKRLFDTSSEFFLG